METKVRAGHKPLSVWKKLQFAFTRPTTEWLDLLIDQEQWYAALSIADRFLRKQPGYVPVVLARARCYEKLGQKNKAQAEIELAYSLDDTFIPAMLQRAMLHKERKELIEALEIMVMLKDHPLVADSIELGLAEIGMMQADVGNAREFQLRSWMANFDSLQHANGYLFRLSYHFSDELWVAQEHQFWAQTQPIYTGPGPEEESLVRSRLDSYKLPSMPAKRQGVTRIGYWGSDFKEHSVRYFARPLLANHNQTTFEIVIYNDNFMRAEDDEHTRAYRAMTPYFYDTVDFDNAEIATLIAGHQLDVLVDIQGHTSANRLNLLQHRFAPLQLTGLAYPPTTGLKTIDYKMIDRHISTPNGQRYYTERQMVLPESFWCFDPYDENIPYSDVAPCTKNGAITFACFGNAAKISPPILESWAKILRSRQEAKLLIISMSFTDAKTLGDFETRMGVAGVPREQVELRGPQSGAKLWLLYQEVDLVLDTFPFNGGTTSCWATYAGVPVLTVAGESLTSRMGCSVMCNLGFPEFVVDDFDQYVNKAIELASDPGPIREFRQVARTRFKASSLGNGAKFAMEFEAACIELLERAKKDAPLGPEPDVPALPLEETLRRARMVWYHGNIEGSRRILAYARKYYPAETKIDELDAEIALAQRDWHAFDALVQRVKKPSFQLRHHQAKACIVRNQTDEVFSLIEQMQLEDIAQSTTEDRLQLDLWAAWRSVYDHNSTNKLNEAIVAVGATLANVCIVIVGNDPIDCHERVCQLDERLIPPKGTVIRYETCSVRDRVEVLNKINTEGDVPDLVVLVRENIEVVNPYLIQDMAAALESADVIGVAGAARWIQKDWTQDLPHYKAWGLIAPSKLAEGLYELHFAGFVKDRIIRDMVVLDGKLLGYCPKRLPESIQLDEDMGDGEFWAEEDWVNRLHSAGKKLHVDRALGIVVHPSKQGMSMHTTQGQLKLLKRLGVEPLSVPHRDFTIQSVLFASSWMALLASRQFCENHVK